MPNIPLRVNSLTTEHPDNAQIIDDKRTLNSFLSHLSTITLDAPQQVIGVVTTKGGQWLSTLLSLLYFKVTSQNKRYQLQLYTKADAHTLAQIAANSQLSGATNQQLKDIASAHISGCHRLTLADGKLIIDLHLGTALEQLKAQISAKDPDKAVHAWLLDTDEAICQAPEPLIWQLARLSCPSAPLFTFSDTREKESASRIGPLSQAANKAGFQLCELNLATKDDQCVTIKSVPSNQALDIAQQERRALRRQLSDSLHYNPLYAGGEGETAIIGGGVAGASLALSLAERGKSLTFFCMDEAPGQQASGNKQGAIYPLLTPEHGSLSHYFLQGYLFSRQRILQLIEAGHDIPHDFCGVLQTGHDQRSQQRLEKIIRAQPWAESIAQAVDAEKAKSLAGIAINHQGIYYPLGGWVSPQALTRAALAQAEKLGKQTCHYQCKVTDIRYDQGHWYLSTEHAGKQAEYGPFANLVLANGRHLTDFSQTTQLPISGFRGQVSHIPSRGELTALKTVLCSHGYLTPAHDKLHCTGASYVKDPDNLAYSPTEQLENLDKIRTSYRANWTQDVDISGHSARVGVRMVTRDHAPMMGCAPDFDAIASAYQQHQHTKESIKYWRSNPAPVYQGLFVLGGLGSRGLTSGPLAAEILAAQLCGELLPANIDILTMLNPNRMWMRKLLKGKAL